MFLSDQARDVLARDDSKTPHAVDIRGKLRNIIAVKSANNNPGVTPESPNELLLGFLPAGRTRVLMEPSSIKSSIALGACEIIAKSYKGATPVPGAGTVFPGIVNDVKIGTATPTAATTVAILPEAEFAISGFTFTSLEDVKLVLKTTNAITDAAVIKASIMFVQE